jgi:WD40 repeat protein
MRARVRIAYVTAAVLASLGLGGALSAPAEGSLELLSTGPTAGPIRYDHGSAMASADARHVFFESRERLVPQDDDPGCLDFTADDPYTAPRIDCLDVYERFNGQTRLVSLGGNGPYDAHLRGVSADGSKAFFTTAEGLLAGDTNGAGDVYAWSNGALELVSAGATRGANWVGASEDGSKVFFDTADRITPDDHNDCGDIYVRSSGQTTLVSTGPDDTTTTGYACYAYAIDGVNKSRAISSPDGSHFFFLSRRPLVARSGNPHEEDLYERIGNQTRLVSTGPIAGTRDVGGPTFVDFITASPDGSRVFFRTNDPLVPEDTGNDTSYDIYEADSTGVHLFETPDVRSDPALSMEPLATSFDGSRVFLWTNARLAPNDFDNEFDIYERSGGTYTLISTGPTDASGGFIQLELFKYAFSRDGSRVFFETEKRLVPGDTNYNVDLYVREAGVTRLVTAGTPGYFNTVQITADGRHAFLVTADRLLPTDTDSALDVYEWDDGTLKLVEIGVPTPDHIGLVAFSQDARRLILSTPQALTPDDTDTLYDLYAFQANQPPDCSGVAATRTLLWPPNRRLRLVEIFGATDPDGDAVTLTITGVTQDERLGSRPDAARTPSPDTVRLRATRLARGDGRVYRVSFTASDGQASCSGTVKVSVPRNRRTTAVDSAPPSYDSFAR